MGIPIGNSKWKLRKLFSNTGGYANPSASGQPILVVIAGIDTPNEYITVDSNKYKIVALFNESEGMSGGYGFERISILAGDTPETLKVVKYIDLQPTGFENVINKTKFSVLKAEYNKLTNQFLLYFSYFSNHGFYIFKTSNFSSFTQLKLNATVNGFYNYNSKNAYANYFIYTNYLISNSGAGTGPTSYCHFVILLEKRINGYDMLFLYKDAQYLLNSVTGAYLKIETFVPNGSYCGGIYNPIKDEIIFASNKEICQIALSDILNFNTKVRRTPLSGNVGISQIIQNGNYIYGVNFGQWKNYKFFESINGGTSWSDFTSNYNNSPLLTQYNEYNYVAPRIIDGYWITTQGDRDISMKSKCHSLNFNSSSDQIIFDMSASDATSIKFSMSNRRGYQYGLIYSPYQKSYFYLLGGCGTAGFGILYAHDSYVSSVSVSPNGTEITTSGTGSISKTVTWRITSLSHNKRKKKIA